jgi:hypothetical protein
MCESNQNQTRKTRKKNITEKEMQQSVDLMAQMQKEYDERNKNNPVKPFDPDLYKDCGSV